MKKLLALLILVVPAIAQAQNIEGQIIASQYGHWQVAGYAPDTYTFAPTACRVQGGSSFFPAFTVGTPVRIVDGNPLYDETVTPTNVVLNNTTCTISIHPAFHHNLPFYLTSATGGLQEAINANATNPDTNTIILNNAWYQLGGTSSMIASVRGFAQLGLIDITTVPSDWYQWNGANYILVPVLETVSSVFGRTGAVTAQTGDYTCDQVSNCWDSPSTFFSTTIAAAVAPTDQSITLASPPASSHGWLYVDSEWIYYNAVDGNVIAIPAGGRGLFATNPASHSVGAQVVGAIQVIGNSTGAPFVVAGSAAAGYVVGINNPFPNSINATTVMEINQGSNETTFDQEGWIHQGDPDAYGLNTWRDPVFVGTFDLDLFPTGSVITSTGNIFEMNVPQQLNNQLGVGAGIAGKVEAVQAATIGAAIVKANFVPSGSTTWSYVCAGKDTDGNWIPGTPVSATNLAASFPPGPPYGYVAVACPYAAGVATYYVYRTAGGAASGLVASGSGPAFAATDLGGALDGSSPPAANGNVPGLCVNGEQFCILSGSSATPPISCTAAQEGWEYHDVAATPPAVYFCESAAWQPSSAVTSFNSRTGSVVPTTGDYTAAMITNAAATNAANTFTVEQTNSAAGAASTPAFSLTGLPYTGGTGTTTYPLFLFQASGATAVTSYSTDGTFLGVNAASGFNGNDLDFHVNGGQTAFSVSAGGSLYSIGNGAFYGSIQPGIVEGHNSAPTISFSTGTGSMVSGSTNVAGTLTSSTSGSIAFTLTWGNGQTYAHRAVCQFVDETTHADSIASTTATAATLTASGTTAAGDTVAYSCVGY
jgi:hypothetical protein